MAQLKPHKSVLQDYVEMDFVNLTKVLFQDDTFVGGLHMKEKHIVQSDTLARGRQQTMSDTDSRLQAASRCETNDTDERWRSPPKSPHKVKSTYHESSVEYRKDY
jgi:hypothetical protein